MPQNAYTHGLAHMRTVTGNLPPPKTDEKERPKATLRHHVDEMHRNDEERPRFKMEVLKVFGGDALLRQVSEAVLIREDSGQMNRQHEWRMAQLPSTCCGCLETKYGRVRFSVSSAHVKN